MSHVPYNHMIINLKAYSMDINYNVFSLHRLILEKEGARSLFRGLGPNLVGVAPSRYVHYYLQYSWGALCPLLFS